MFDIIDIMGLSYGFALIFIAFILFLLLYSERREAKPYSNESKRLMQLLTDGKIDQLKKELNEKYRTIQL